MAEPGVARIPSHRTYRVGAVSEITGVPAHVLRYWESEFPSLRPAKTRGGQRLYSADDIELILEIKTLLYEERFTIAGARQRLRTVDGGEPIERQEERARIIEDVRKEIRAILTLMEANDKL